MSKAYGNAIELFADEKQVRKQIMGIVTDSTPVDEPKDPEGSPLFGLWSLFGSPAEREEMAERFRSGGLGYGEVKKDLVSRVLDYFGPARETRAALSKDPGAVEEVLRRGAGRARETARPLVEEARRASGLGSA